MVEGVAVEGITASELLKQVFESMQRKLEGREIQLPSAALAEIANDSDWHRTRIGYMSYQAVTLVKIDDKEWALAFGSASGDYPAGPYSCDIVVLPVSTNGKSDEQLVLEIHDALAASSYFRNSLVYAMYDGSLAGAKNGRFTQSVIELLRPRIMEFTAQEMEINRGVVHLDLRPVVKSSYLYKPEFVTFLSDSFCDLLGR